MTNSEQEYILLTSWNATLMKHTEMLKQLNDDMETQMQAQKLEMKEAESNDEEMASLKQSASNKNDDLHDLKKKMVAMRVTHKEELQQFKITAKRSKSDLLEVIAERDREINALKQRESVRESQRALENEELKKMEKELKESRKKTNSAKKKEMMEKFPAFKAIWEKS